VNIRQHLNLPVAISSLVCITVFLISAQRRKWIIDPLLGHEAYSVALYSACLGILSGILTYAIFQIQRIPSWVYIFAAIIILFSGRGRKQITPIEVQIENKTLNKAWLHIQNDDMPHKQIGFIVEGTSRLACVMQPISSRENIALTLTYNTSRLTTTVSSLRECTIAICSNGIFLNKN